MSKTPCFGTVQKPVLDTECSDARHEKTKTARRILTYVERCGLQRNAADTIPAKARDERFVKPFGFFR